MSDVQQGPPVTEAEKRERLPRVLKSYADSIERQRVFVVDSGFLPVLRRAVAMLEEAAALAPSGEATAKVTRVELIDHRSPESLGGRRFVAWDCSVELSYQDDARTLKVFVGDAARLHQEKPT